jgi:hypothetical protein
MIALAGSLPSPPEPEVKGAKPMGVFDLRAVDGQARRSGRGQPWPGSYRTYASV